VQELRGEGLGEKGGKGGEMPAVWRDGSAVINKFTPREQADFREIPIQNLFSMDKLSASPTPITESGV
jgi:hypothetical protein